VRRLFPAVVLVAALALAAPAPAARGQAGVATPVEQRFQALDPPARAEVMQAVLDFAPGAWTPVHTHGGPVYVTVLEGTATLRMGGMDRTFRPGEGWLDSPDEPHAAGNDGATTARVVATFILPAGATPTIVAETGAGGALPPGPTTVAQHRFDPGALPRPLDVVHRVLELAPGATVPVHSHPGPTVVSAIEGSGTLSMGGTSESRAAGESWVEPPNAVHGGAFAGSGRFRIVASYLVPRGMPDTILAGQPAPAAAPLAAPQPAPAPAQIPRAR
jgi:quercetin dioxygenase-like cupin family protein